MRAGMLAMAAAALFAQRAQPVFTTILDDAVSIVGEANGTLYGSTDTQVVSLAPPASPGGLWTQTVLYQAQGFVSGLVMNRQAGGLPIFYGLTQNGGTSNLGALFSLTPPASPGGAWTETDLYSFSGIDKTSYPSNPSGLVQGGNGVFYGVTAGVVEGPPPPEGNPATVFSLTPPASPGGAWTQEVLYTYTPANGTTYPLGNVVRGSGPDGRPVLYGTNIDEHSVYELTPPAVPGGSWTPTVIATGGSWSLVLGKDGILYGTNPGGGADGFGSVFSLTPPAQAGDSWTETTIYSVSGSALGITASAIAINPDGVLYATTISNDGGYPGGAIFSLTPPKTAGNPWTERTLQSFPASQKFTRGASPAAPIWIGGVLYGATGQGGPFNTGTVFMVAQ